MKALFKATPKLTFEVSGDDQKSIFAELADIQEIFSTTFCGKCGSDDIKFVKRTVEENDYYELHCKKCYAKLGFGQHKKGKSLFPKRKDDDGKYLPDGGWVKWNPETKTNE